jgi:lipopolysaccharide transport system permease protein
MLQPMLLAMLFATVLAKLFNQPFRDQALYVFSGVVAWELFTSAVMGGSHALINVEGFLRQSRIPLLVFHVRAALVNVSIGALGCLGFSIFCAVIAPDIFSIYWVFLPVWFAVIFVFSIPVIIVSSIVNVLFRDYQQAIGVLMQALWYVSPAFIPRHVFDAPGIIHWTNVNPAASLLDLFRDPMIYHRLPEVHDFLNLGAWTVGLTCLAVGLLARYERKIIFLF